MMKKIKCYKIVELKSAGTYSTLFHGVNGTRNLPLDTWIKSVRKWAGEGGQKYWTGFHVFLDQDIGKQYMKKFTSKNRNRVLVDCFAMNLRLKKSSNGKVYLADKLFISSS